jgi:hypothetical protein
MTKEELIAKMANSAGITKVAATVALEAFTGAVTTSLKKGKTRDIGELRDLHDFKTQGQDGTQSTYRRSLEDSCRPHSQVFGRQRTQSSGQVDPC